jgi:hypothetical protein
MMNPALHREAVQELGSEIAQLREKISELEQVMEWHRSHIDQNNGESVLAVNQETFSALTQAEAIERIMKRTRRTMRPAQIVDVLEAARYRPKSKRPALLNSTYTTMKRREDIFVAYQDGTWGLAELEKKYEETDPTFNKAQGK